MVLTKKSNFKYVAFSCNGGGTARKKENKALKLIILFRPSRRGNTDKKFIFANILSH